MKKTRIIRLIKQLGPWFFSAIILYVIFLRIDIKGFFYALQHANMAVYLPLIIFFIVIWLFIEAQNLTALLKHFKHDVTYKNMVELRGGTYFLMAANYHLGSGGMAYYLNRDHNIPLLRGASLMLFYTILTQLSLFVMAAIGCVFIYEPSTILDWILLLSIVAILVYIVAIVSAKSLPSIGFIKTFKNMTIFKTFYEASYRGYLLLTFWRILYYSTFIFLYYGAVKAFNMDIPFGILSAYVPVILLLIGLPITPFGLGTVQAAMLVFFKDYGDEATILAFGITYSTSIMLLRSIVGLLFFGKIEKRESTLSKK